MFSCTRFSELMKGLPRSSFQSSVDAFKGDKHSKGFSCFDQLIAMVFGQVSGCNSLREIEHGFNSSAAHHPHLGTHRISRSTLSEANEKRDSAIYEHACVSLMNKMSRSTRKRYQERLLIIDSTPIQLVGRGYDSWAKANKVRSNQGLKTHIVLCSESGLPESIKITPPNVNDIEVGRELEIEPGVTYAVDKGYCDYNWWNEIDEAGAYFVTRLKINAAVKAVQEQVVESGGPVKSDTTIEFKTSHPGAKRRNHYYGKELRRIVVEREGKSAPLILVTNDVHRSAEQIAQVYKRRWEIENFFKWLKQNLKIKRFVGRSENAVKIQIYSALIAQLLLEWFRQRHVPNESLKAATVIVRTGLFQPICTHWQRHKERRRKYDEYLQNQATFGF